MKHKLDMHVLGCKVNYADARRLLELLPDADGGPVALVATCCVTAEGEKQSRKHVRRASRRLGGAGTVLVTGCASRLHPQSFRDLADNVVVLEGDIGEAARQAGGVLKQASAPAKVPAAPDARTRYFLKVQDGCANHCSYCVIPQVRGRPRSLPLDALLDEAAAAVDRGYPELVVSGINVGAYNDAGAGLAGLLARLSRIDGLLRLRLSSIEALDITPGLLQELAASGIFARHLHVPLQSGDDRVLADMGRRYDRRLFAERLELARGTLPGVNITTDVIVGYPGEDEQAFRNTLELVEAADITRVHVFGYSQRPGTAAATRPGQVPPDIIRERSLRLRELSDRLGEAHRRRKPGGTSEILLESAVEPGRFTGLSGDYTRFVVDEAADNAVKPAAGKLVTVAATEVTADAVMGKVVT